MMLDIIKTGPDSLCAKDYYRGYEISIVMELEESGHYTTRDVRVYKGILGADSKRYSKDMTYAFAGLIYESDETDNISADILYCEGYHVIKRIIDVLVDNE